MELKNDNNHGTEKWILPMVAAHFKLQTFSFGKENGHLDMAKDIMRCPSAFEKHLAIEVKLPDSNLPHENREWTHHRKMWLG